jgi:fumarate hydratase subunit beta
MKSETDTKTMIQLPVSEKIVRKLRVGDIVFVSGIVYTMRDMGHRRISEMLKQGETPPFNLKDGGIWHCGPIARKVDDIWEILSAGPTSSSRFTELGPKLVEDLHVRLIIGKGTMGTPMINALKDVGGVYLLATGGCAALYAKKVVNVENVHWLDLGMPEATWILKVDQLGPLTVGIDSNGRTLSQMVLDNVSTRIEDIYKEEGIDSKRTYVWWPKQVAGSKELMDHLRASTTAKKTSD